LKPPPFLYARPATLPEALDLLTEEDAKVLAGGQSFVPLLNLRLARPATVVDVALLRELHPLTADGEVLVLGAGVRQRAAETSELVQRMCPLIPKALRMVGHLQTRTRGTFGGSLVHADPAAELPAVALVAAAELVAVSRRGSRTIPADEFFLGPFMSALAEDELLVEVRIPKQAWTHTFFRELTRRAGDFAVAGIAGGVRLVDGARSPVADVRLAALGVGGTPLRLRAAEDELRDRPLTPDTVAAAARAAAAEVDPSADAEADASYRREIVRVLVSRVLSEAAPA
jgi:carbon-monoxide dehydrogenase medium subunit